MQAALTSANKQQQLRSGVYIKLSVPPQCSQNALNNLQGISYVLNRSCWQHASGT